MIYIGHYNRAKDLERHTERGDRFNMNAEREAKLEAYGRMTNRLQTVDSGFLQTESIYACFRESVFNDSGSTRVGVFRRGSEMRTYREFFRELLRDTQVDSRMRVLSVRYFPARDTGETFDYLLVRKVFLDRAERTYKIIKFPPDFETSDFRPEGDYEWLDTVSSVVEEEYYRPKADEKIVWKF